MDLYSFLPITNMDPRPGTEGNDIWYALAAAALCAAAVRCLRVLSWCCRRCCHALGDRGWTDPETSREYALVGLTTGTAFVDITDPATPLYLGLLPTATSSSIWRDIKVYSNHAFVVSEARRHGIQVFDLTRLRGVLADPGTSWTADAQYTRFGSAHNIVINEDSGYAYAVGTTSDIRNNPCTSGLHIVDIRTPKR